MIGIEPIWLSATGGGLPLQRLLALIPDPDSGIMTGVITGIGAITNDRSTERLVLDYDGIYQTINAGDLAWAGARYSGGIAYATDSGGDFLQSMPFLSHSPAAINSVPYSRDLTNSWIANGTCTVTYDQPGIQNAANTASKLVNLGTTTANDIRINLSGLIADAFVGLTIEIKTITTSGILKIKNIQSILRGEWTVDLSKVSSTSFTRLHEGHPAVTVDAIFQETAAATGGLRLYTLSGTVDIIIGNINYLDNTTDAEACGVPPIITEGGPASIEADGYSLDIANHDNDEVCYYLEWSPSYDYNEISAHQRILASTNAGLIVFDFDTAGAVGTNDGTSQTNLVGLTYNANDVLRVGLVASISSNLFQININGVWSTAKAYDGFTVGASLNIFLNCTLPSKIRNLQRNAIAGNDKQKAKIDELMINYLTGDSFTDHLIDEFGNSITV